MKAKEYLLRYKEYDNRANRYKAEYKAESAIINDLVKSRKILERGMGKIKYKYQMAMISEFAESLNDRANEATREKNDIMATLSCIPDFERDVLCARYIDQMKWEDIATRFCYSWNGIFKAHDRAIRMLQKHLDESIGST